MYTEKLGDWEYTRLEPSDWTKLKGKRVNGHGRIVGWTNAEGEQHPAVVRTEDGSLFTPEDLAVVDFDGRHGIITQKLPA